MKIHWQPIEAFDLNSTEQHWLSIKDSMTAALNQLSLGAITIDVLTEAELYDQDDQCDYWLREICLNVGDKPWMLAQSVIPKSESAIYQAITQLHRQPIGELLFSNPHTTRSPIEYQKLSKSTIESEFNTTPLPALKDNSSYWCRHSSLILPDVECHLFEVFLPLFWLSVTDQTS